MEQVHGVDVSWMTHGSPKDRSTRSSASLRPAVSSSPTQDAPRSSPPPATSPSTDTNGAATATGDAVKPPSTNDKTNSNDEKKGPATTAKPIPTKPGIKRVDSGEKPGPNGTPPSRRNSWFSNISSKFSSMPHAPGANGNHAPQQVPSTPPKENEPQAPKLSPNRNAVLAHAARPPGDQPYTPAPPSKGQSSFLGVFRRLSSSGAGSLSQGQKGNHGLVERKTLNVDQNRERCGINELHQANLRRVAFSVDVEIAPMPRYADTDTTCKSAPGKEKTEKRQMTEKSEGEALKHPKTVEDQKETEGVVRATGENLPKEPAKEGTEATAEAKPEKTAAEKERETKKKEKKKKSEGERKARKEKKRKLAEANGTIPLELHLDSDSSTEASAAATSSSGSSPRSTSSPTINPVRIYRRCCQLRETPILKKITEQLTNSDNCSDGGVIERIDLTGYWLQLPDLITLGDYLAVVPVKEVLLESCGLSDEGLRVILAGLLAARKPEARRRKPVTHPDGLTEQGGVVERLVLKNNKLGIEGWKHVCLFIYLCRSLKYLDLSMATFPRPPPPKAQNGNKPPQPANQTTGQGGATLANLLSKAVGQRLAGSTLELLHIGGINPTSEELGIIIDGVIECGVKRLGLAHNNLDEKGFEHVARFVADGKCEGLDLGGNDLREHMEVLAKAVTPKSSLWGLSLAECNLSPSSLCKIFPKLVPLSNFRFIDLSHNRDLCNSDPSAIGMLRKYLPKLQHLRRVHLADVAMTSEQAIALTEILPEVQGLAHVSLLENPELVKLADARTAEAQEEACALYASLMAATRISSSIVCLDIDVPGEQSGEIVKAMAKQTVAYCLRNLQRFPISEISDAVQALSDTQETANGQPEQPPYPDILVHLVGHDVMDDQSEDDAEDVDKNGPTPDENYVIGGTGLVKALACCLKNRGDESRRQSGEFLREVEGGGRSAPPTPPTRPKLPPGKAKDMSKHLLAGARKIRIRLQPAIAKAKENLDEEKQNFQKLMFLDTTLENIIKRFEDEFPDTRVGAKGGDREGGLPLSLPQAEDAAAQQHAQDQLGASLPSSTAAELGPEQIAIPSSDPEDDPLDLAIRPSLSRTTSASALSHTSKALADEEGRMLRAGHKFRLGIVKPEHYDLLNGLDEATIDHKHMSSIRDMVEELDDPELNAKIADKGVIRMLREDREKLREALKERDPEYWERFVEAQEKARGNVKVGGGAQPAAGGGSASAAGAGTGAGAASRPPQQQTSGGAVPGATAASVKDESAVED